MNLILLILVGFASLFVTTVFILVVLEAWQTLFDLVFKTVATIIGLGLSLKAFFQFIHWCLSNNYEPDYDTGTDLFAGASYTQKETFEKEIKQVLQNISESPTPQENPSQKSTGGYDFTIKEIVNDRGGVKKHAPGSQAAIDAWNNSPEKKALEAHRARIENKIRSLGGANDDLDS